MRFRTECDEAGAIEEPLVAEVELAETALAEAISAHEARQSLRNDAAEEASRFAARVEALELALDAARARAGAERLAGVDGVLGTLLDLIEIDPGWEAAVEAALARSAVEPGEVDSVTFGMARQAGEGPNIARQITIKGGQVAWDRNGLTRDDWKHTVTQDGRLP